jgi:cytoskeletal protein RodZ
MTTRDQLRRVVRGDRGGTANGAPVGPVETLPERLYAARERKGVDLYRAERDTKIRARYLGALERGDYNDLPGAVYTKGFLRNYALYLGLDPDEILAQWRRERSEPREAQAVITVPRPLAAPRQGLTFSPFVVVLALMTVGVILFGAYVGVQLLRFAKPPTLTVTDPPSAVVDVNDSTTSYVLRGTTLAGATVTVTTPGHDPYTVSADSTGNWSAEVDLRRGRNQFGVSAVDPDTAKKSTEDVQIYITVPILANEAPTLSLDQPAEGATYQNGAIPIQGSTTNAISVVVTAKYAGSASAPAPGAKSTPAPPPAPVPVSVTVAEDGTFSAPLELTAGKWAITVTASNKGGVKTAALTRNVTVAYKGVNLTVTIKSGRAWLKVWVDGQVSDQTGQAGKVFSPGQVLTFAGKTSVEVRTGKSSATYFTVNGTDLGNMSDVGNPETWLFSPPDAPVQTTHR